MRTTDFAPPADLQPLADGVYAYVQPDGSWCLNNAGVVVDGDDVLVVDTAATEGRARALRAAIEKVTPASPRLVVNTHFHGDHTFGNRIVGPTAMVVAQHDARREMAAAGLGLRQLWPDVDWGVVDVRLPHVTYRDELVLHLDERRVVLLHPGPAHTGSDTVAWIPEHAVLFAGDIVMNGVTPFCLMGSIEGSVRAIDRLRAMRPRTVVPGHGTVGGTEVLDETQAYLRWILELARAGLAAGHTPGEAARKAGEHRFAHLLDAERLLPNLMRAYAELRGASLEVLAAFDEMVRFHGRLPACHA